MNCCLSLLLLFVAISAARANVIKRPFAAQHPFSNGKGGKLGIFDGSKTTIQKHPYMVSLSYAGEVFGSGTILSNKYILTIADLVAVLPMSDIKVVAGSTTVSGKKISVARVIPHPEYGYSIYDYDVAILKLAEKLTFSSTIKAITLPSKNPSANTAMTVTGWGDTGPEEPTSTLLQGTMKWLATKTCKETSYGRAVFWSRRMACAYNESKTTLCKHDYGDPFVSDGVIYGMFINGPSSGFCSTVAHPVLLADVYSMVAWIKKTANIE